jgi:hypothetical protein
MLRREQAIALQDWSVLKQTGTTKQRRATGVKFCVDELAVRGSHTMTSEGCASPHSIGALPRREYVDEPIAKLQASLEES